MSMVTKTVTREFYILDEENVKGVDVMINVCCHVVTAEHISMKFGG